MAGSKLEVTRSAATCVKPPCLLPGDAMRPEGATMAACTRLLRSTATLGVVEAEDTMAEALRSTVCAELTALRFAVDLRSDSHLVLALAQRLRAHREAVASLVDSPRWLAECQSAAVAFAAKAMREGFSDLASHCAAMMARARRNQTASWSPRRPLLTPSVKCLVTLSRR